MGRKDAPTAYEKARKQRLEANKRRMEELGISTLSRSLSTASKRPPKSPTVRRSKPNTPVKLSEQRRSSRIALKPVPAYQDMDEIEFSAKSRRRSAWLCGIRIKRSFISDQARYEAALAAKDIETIHPSFVKKMQPSHVSSCFWLGLPAPFCKAHMPKEDTLMFLVDEEEMEWRSLYLARKTGLSAGWKRFAEDHELEDGDAVAFELVAHDTFNVVIKRARNYEAGLEEDQKS